MDDNFQARIFTSICKRLKEDIGGDSLEDVDLSNTSLGPEQIRPFCRAIIDHLKYTNQSSRLRTLDLGGNRICGMDMKRYFEADQDELEYDYSGFTELCDCIGHNKGGLTLFYLSLFRNPLGERGGELLGDLVANCSTLQELNISECCLGSNGARCVFNGLSMNSSLKILYMRKNKIGAGYVEDISASLNANSKISFLDLGQNEFGSRGVTEMLGTLRCVSLNSLILSNNEVDDIGAAAVGEFIKIGRGNIEQIE